MTIDSEDCRRPLWFPCWLHTPVGEHFWDRDCFSGHLTRNTIMWQLNINRWIRCLLMKPVSLVAVLFSFCCGPFFGFKQHFPGWHWSPLLTSPCRSFCSTATTPRRPRGWTPAWQRRRSPLRSVRMEVCAPLQHSARLLERAVIPLTAAHVFAQGHSSPVYLPCITWSITPRILTQLIKQAFGINCDSVTALRWHVTREWPETPQWKSSGFSWNPVRGGGGGGSTWRDSRPAFVSPGC